MEHQDGYITEKVFDERQRLLDERFARDKERLEQNEDLLRKVSDCQISLTEILKNQESKINQHEERLAVVESRPAGWFDKIMSAAIAAITSGVIALLFNVIK